MIKTQPFLPLPAPTSALPAPIATVTSNTPISAPIPLIIDFMVALIIGVAIASILIWKRKKQYEEKQAH
ncbi:MAG TPA: hypothetical protein VK253_00255 [Candidatus Binatia bacterium]|nr:hypothetical protein [Candidatus Binatia bacterium]